MKDSQYLVKKCTKPDHKGIITSSSYAMIVYSLVQSSQRLPGRREWVSLSWDLSASSLNWFTYLSTIFWLEDSSFLFEVD